MYTLLFDRTLRSVTQAHTLVSFMHAKDWIFLHDAMFEYEHSNSLLGVELVKKNACENESQISPTG